MDAAALPNAHNHPNSFVTKVIDGSEPNVLHSWWKFSKIDKLTEESEKLKTMPPMVTDAYNSMDGFMRMPDNTFKPLGHFKAEVTGQTPATLGSVVSLPRSVFHSVVQTGERCVTLLLLPLGNVRDGLVYFFPETSQYLPDFFKPSKQTPISPGILWDEVLTTLHNLVEQDGAVKDLLKCDLPATINHIV